MCSIQCVGDPLKCAGTVAAGWVTGVQGSIDATHGARRGVRGALRGDSPCTREGRTPDGPELLGASEARLLEVVERFVRLVWELTYPVHTRTGYVSSFLKSEQNHKARRCNCQRADRSHRFSYLLQLFAQFLGIPFPLLVLGIQLAGGAVAIIKGLLQLGIFLNLDRYFQFKAGVPSFQLLLPLLRLLKFRKQPVALKNRARPFFAQILDFKGLGRYFSVINSIWYMKHFAGKLRVRHVWFSFRVSRDSDAFPW